MKQVAPQFQTHRQLTACQALQLVLDRSMNELERIIFTHAWAKGDWEQPGSIPVLMSTNPTMTTWKMMPQVGLLSKKRSCVLRIHKSEEGVLTTGVLRIPRKSTICFWCWALAFKWRHVVYPQMTSHQCCLLTCKQCLATLGRSTSQQQYIWIG